MGKFTAEPKINTFFMKKILLLINIFIFCNTGFAQKLTLSETVEYINNKLKENNTLSEYNQFEELQITSDGYWMKNIYREVNGSNELLHSLKVFALDLVNQWKVDKSLLGGISVEASCLNKDCITAKNYTSNGRSSIYNEFRFYVTYKPEGEKLANALAYALSLSNKLAETAMANDDDPFSSKNYKSNDVEVIGNSSNEKIKLLKQNGVYHIKISIGGLVESFVFDTGASDVLISKEMEKNLISRGLLKKTNYLKDGLYRIADGSIIKQRRLLIPKLKIGNFTLTNVEASVTDSNTLLLGKSVLDKFKTWNVDNVTQTLELNK